MSSGSVPRSQNNEKAASGIRGLDELLAGGFPKGRLHLIEGSTGTGKTTLGLQFLVEGVKRGEKGMYIALSETKQELLAVAESHGWSLEGIDLYEYSAAQQLRSDAEQTIISPAEIELSETMKDLLEAVERANPARVVFDSLAEIPLLAGSPLRNRLQILKLKAYFSGRNSTVLLIDETVPQQHDAHLGSILHGVLLLEHLAPAYGEARRRLRVVKMRGMKVSSGHHDFNIVTGGIIVYPRLVAAEHRGAVISETLSSGISQLDVLLGGGLDRGTSSLLMGPAGAGKSSVALQYAIAAASRGERSAIYTFDERVPTILARAEGLGMKLGEALAARTIAIHEVDPAELSPGAFSDKVRQAVEIDGVRIVVIDSLTGYLNTMPDERFLLLHMHELLAYLGHLGVSTLLTVAQHGMHAVAEYAGIDVSYLVDTVMLFRYFELAGEVRLAVSVFKKRSGNHERTIRELRLRSSGIEIGPPLKEFRGVLTGTPLYETNTPPIDES